MTIIGVEAREITAGADRQTTNNFKPHIYAIAVAMSLCYYTLIMKSKNTLQKGSVRYLVFRDGGTFFGVALEFNIVVEATHPMEALLLLHEAVVGYLEATKRVKMRSHILNQTPDPEYEKMWREYQGRKLKEKYEGIVRGLPILSGGWLELTRK